ncbi:MAG: DivIVA domain-containing protein [Propionibacteriales bacterium]|nr:DivIVA domain-containing protein [Propionibacteriales bacterium]
MSHPMMWVFAVLIVLAMGGVAMLAAGHGEPMAPAYDDRPDALVPADRRIDAGDLRRVRFSLAFRGYRMSEVDALLTRMATEMEARVTVRTPEYWGKPTVEAPGDTEDPTSD